MKLLDTNIVIYALGGEHPYRDPCRAVINQLEGRHHDYAVSAEMLQEVLSVFWNKRDLKTGIEAVNKLLAVFPSPIPITGVEVALAMRLIASGEKTGRVPEMLDRAADALEAESRNLANAFSALLQPLMILVVGVFVLLVVLAIMLPILDLNRLVG